MAVNENVTFNDAPLYSVVMFEDKLKFLKLRDAVPNVPPPKQKPNCFNLDTGHYCVLGANAEVKILKYVEDYDDYSFVISD